MTSTTPAPDAGAGMMRNRMLAVAVLFVVAVVGGLSAIALERVAWHHRPRDGDWRGRPMAGWHRPPRERFARELGLSADQQTRIDSLMRRQVEQLRAVRERVRPEVDSIVAQTRRQIDAILTPEQREKARAFAPRFEGRGDGPPGAGPDVGPMGDEPPPGRSAGPGPGPGPGVPPPSRPPPHN